VINLEELTKCFINHARTLRSATFVCSAPTALEGWFRAELVPTLEDIGIGQDSVSSRFIYPGTRDEQADLLVRLIEGLVVFEIMCFVNKKDRRKIERFPTQLNRLESVVQGQIVEQAIAFLTFNGYSEQRQNNLIHDFFDGRNWQVIGPLPIISGLPLTLVIAGFNKRAHTSDFG